MAALYLLLEYAKPHVIYPFFDILPWTQITILLGLFYALAKGQVKAHGTHILLFLFMVVVLVSCVFSYDPTVSWGHTNYIVSWFIVVIFFVGSVRNIEQYKLLTILLFLFLFKLSFFGAKTWALRGFSFTGWGISGPKGFFQNSGELSLLMVCFAMMSFFYIYGQKNISKLYYIVPLTAIMTVLAASSRGSQLALAIVLIFSAIYVGKLKIKYILLVGIVSFLAYAITPEEQKERFSTMGEDGTSESRLTYWEYGIKMMNDNKFIGIGFYAFPSYFEDRYAPYIEFENFRYRREVAHNSYIQVGSELGYTGLIAYFLLIFWFFKLNRKTQNLVKQNNYHTTTNYGWILYYCKGLNLAMLGYLVGSTFMSVAFYPYLYLFLMLSQSLFNVVKSELKNVDQKFYMKPSKLNYY